MKVLDRPIICCTCSNHIPVEKASRSTKCLSLRVTKADSSTAACCSVERTKESNNRGLFKKLGIQSLALLLGATLLVQQTGESAVALDIETAQKTWKCMFGGCRPELARCFADPSCAANVVCLEACNPSDSNCHVRCGDIFQNRVVEDFNSCLVSRKKCIPQKPDDGTFPVPPDCALVDKFSTEDFTGTWYITSGLNPVFDTYDCQVHEFSATPNKLTGKLMWRVTTPDGGFITRTAVQNFKQSPNHPGILSNHDNEYLHYRDDWFIVSARLNKQPDDYMLIYYKGSNDAWEGYGGAIVYTRTPKLPDSIVPELRLAAAKVGLDFDKFKTTDNSCGPQPSLLAKVQKKLSEFESDKALAQVQP